MFKAISIRQPWAGLIVGGFKNVENRTWATRYRGRVLIHASRKYEEDLATVEFIAERLRRPVNWTMAWLHERHFFHGRGSIIGVAVSCRFRDETPMTGYSVWHAVGQYGFYLEKAMAFLELIPWRGQLGLFNVPEEERILGQLRLVERLCGRGITHEQVEGG